MHWSLLSCLLLSLLGLVSALSSSGSRLLVLTDDADADKSKYSKFWSDLADRGFNPTFASAKSSPSLFDLDARTHDHLLILPTSLKALGPTLTPQILLDFAKEGGNILVALSASVPPPSTINSLLLELDIHLAPDRDAQVVDHFNYDTLSASEKHDVLLLTPPKPARSGVKDFFGSGYSTSDAVLAVPRAVPQVLGNDSPLLSSILTAPATAYSYSSKEQTDGAEDPFATGIQLNIVSAVQARNSARLTVLGSAEMLEDRWIDGNVQALSGKKVKSANREFVKRVSAWTFKELGVLKVGNLRHFASPEGVVPVEGVDANPKIYRIKEDVTYEVSLSEYSYDTWLPYIPPPSDSIQLEFTMLSPYHRLPLAPTTKPSFSSNATLYTTSFRTPDQHGIFSFRLNYKRPFLTVVDEKRQVSVRHFAHDEFPRSWQISAAWPWVSGVGVTVLGWVGFVAVWLFSKPVGRGVAGGKKVQ